MRRTKAVPAWSLAVLVGLGLSGLILMALAVHNYRTNLAPGIALVSATPNATPSVTPEPSPFPTRTPVPSTETALPPTPTATVEASATLLPATAETALPTVAPSQTRTPVRTPTSTPPVTPGTTSTPTFTPPPPASGHGITGQLTMCFKPVAADGFQHYYAQTERVCFVELIVNNSSQTVNYSILGVQAEAISGGQSIFQTSWRGDFQLCPGCQGPASGPWEDGLFLPSPGTYVLRLSICYSSVDACLGVSGDWEILTGGITIVGDPAP